MTYLEQLHKAHKERQARFAAFKEPEVKSKIIFRDAIRKKPLLINLNRLPITKPKEEAVNRLIKLICLKYSCTENQLLGKKRLYNLIKARFLMYKISYNHINYNLPLMAKRFKRNTSSLSTTLEVASDHILTFKDWAKDYQDLIRDLNNETDNARANS